MERKYGCIKSVLDGSELNLDDVYNNDMQKSLPIPDEFDYSDKVSNLMNVADQGATSMCVCYSLGYTLECLEIMKYGESSFKLDKNKVYACRSNNYEDCGMQFKEALQYVKNNGYDYNGNIHKIVDYGKLGSEYAIKRALIANGPVLFGLPVYNTNIPEFWLPDRVMLGGHAITCVGYNKDGFILLNSWGRNWGRNGKYVFKYKDFGNLFEAWSIFK